MLSGKHWWLPNGNLLVTDAFEGRAFEINRRGEIVWQYINYIDEKKGVAGLVENVQRLPFEYARFYTGPESGTAKSPAVGSATKSTGSGNIKTSGKGELKK